MMYGFDLEKAHETLMSFGLVDALYIPTKYGNRSKYSAKGIFKTAATRMNDEFVTDLLDTFNPDDVILYCNVPDNFRSKLLSVGYKCLPLPDEFIERLVEAERDNNMIAVVDIKSGYYRDSVNVIRLWVNLKTLDEELTHYKTFRKNLADYTPDDNDLLTREDIVKKGLSIIVESIKSVIQEGTARTDTVKVSDIVKWVREQYRWDIRCEVVVTNAALRDKFMGQLYWAYLVEDEELCNSFPNLVAILKPDVAGFVCDAVFTDAVVDTPSTSNESLTDEVDNEQTEVTNQPNTEEPVGVTDINQIVFEPPYQPFEDTPQPEQGNGDTTMANRKVYDPAYIQPQTYPQQGQYTQPSHSHRYQGSYVSYPHSNTQPHQQQYPGSTYTNLPTTTQPLPEWLFSYNLVSKEVNLIHGMLSSLRYKQAPEAFSSVVNTMRSSSLGQLPIGSVIYAVTDNVRLREMLIDAGFIAPPRYKLNGGFEWGSLIAFFAMMPNSELELLAVFKEVIIPDGVGSVDDQTAFSHLETPAPEHTSDTDQPKTAHDRLKDALNDYLLEVYGKQSGTVTNYDVTLETSTGLSILIGANQTK